MHIHNPSVTSPFTCQSSLIYHSYCLCFSCTMHTDGGKKHYILYAQYLSLNSDPCFSISPTDWPARFTLCSIFREQSLLWANKVPKYTNSETHSADGGAGSGTDHNFRFFMFICSSLFDWTEDICSLQVLFHFWEINISKLHQVFLFHVN